MSASRKLAGGILCLGAAWAGLLASAGDAGDPATGLRGRIKKLVAARIPEFAKKNGIPGCSVAVVFNGGRDVEHFGFGETQRGNGRTPDENTLYETGSISKLLTEILYADAVGRKEVGIVDALQKHVPEGVAVPSKMGVEITLLHLATHRDGLASMQTVGSTVFLKDLTEAEMFRRLAASELRSVPGSQFHYADDGNAFLFFALRRASGIQDSNEFQKRRLSGPLGMKDTVLWASSLTEAQRERLARPYNVNPELRKTSVPGQGYDPKDFGKDEVPHLVSPDPQFISSTRDLGLLAQACLDPSPRKEGPDLRLWLELFHAEPVVQHGGATYGFGNYFGFNWKQGVGFVFCGNNSAANGEIFQMSQQMLARLAALSKEETGD